MIGDSNQPQYKILAKIKDAVIKGRYKQNGSPSVKELVGQALDNSIDAR